MTISFFTILLPLGTFAGVVLGWWLWRPKHDARKVMRETLHQDLLESSLAIFKRGMQNDADPFFMGDELCTRKEGLKPFVDRFNIAYRGLKR